MHDLAHVKLLHVAAYIELDKPTVLPITWRTRAPWRTRNRCRIIPLHAPQSSTVGEPMKPPSMNTKKWRFEGGF